MGKDKPINDLEIIKKSEISGFVAEVFYEQLHFILGDNSRREFWVKNHGMNSRANSKDVIDLSAHTYATNEEIKQAIFIHLGRNSYYHHLPEFFFHPLVISTPSMSNQDVVEEVRKNKKIEQDNVDFFIPFDTELFRERLRLTNRYLKLFTEEQGIQMLMNMSNRIIDKEMHLTKEQYYKLFLFLGNSENLKENFKAQENLLVKLLGYKVKLGYEKKTHRDAPFADLGDGILGRTMGLHGPVRSEFDDVVATMMPTEKMTYKKIKKDMKTIADIMEFFVFANRSILLRYQPHSKNEIRLGENYLGYNTILVSKQKPIKVA
ncbi:MAG: hypothetical protein OIF50_07100 [Flavobacteriaceae bacterium]|nr:hypothetical protein [Flavobacteriaceae bacterium]